MLQEKKLAEDAKNECQKNSYREEIRKAISSPNLTKEHAEYR